MSYAIRKDGQGWRAVNSQDDVADDEVFSETQPGPIQPTQDDLAAMIRAERDARIAASDWTQVRDIPDALALKWQPYRQALRDVTKQADFPETVTWPEVPA